MKNPRILASLIVLISALYAPNSEAGGFLAGLAKGFAKGGAAIQSDPYYKQKKLYENADEKVSAVQELSQQESQLLASLKSRNENLSRLMRQYEAAK